MKHYHTCICDIVPESGDFLGEFGDSALFGGEEATAKSKSETIITKHFQF